MASQYGGDYDYDATLMATADDLMLQEQEKRKSRDTAFHRIPAGRSGFEFAQVGTVSAEGDCFWLCAAESVNLVQFEEAANSYSSAYQSIVWGSAATLRERGYEYMLQHRDDFEKFVKTEDTIDLTEGDRFEEYINAQKKKAAWKDDCAVSVFAQESKVIVLVFSSDSVAPFLCSPAEVTCETPVVILLLSHYHSYSRSVADQELSHYYYVKLEAGKYTTRQKLLTCGFSVTAVQGPPANSIGVLACRYRFSGTDCGADECLSRVCAIRIADQAADDNYSFSEQGDSPSDSQQSASEPEEDEPNALALLLSDLRSPAVPPAPWVILSNEQYNEVRT